MLYKLPYGDESISVDLDEKSIIGVLTSKSLPSIGNLKETMSDTMKNPVGTKPLNEIVKPGERICIIVGDMTRLWVRHDLFLPYLFNELNEAGIKDEDIFIVSATGAHRNQSDEEHRMIVGDEVFNRVKVYDHDSKDKKNLVYLGTTSRGTPVWINRMVHEADRIIVTGGVVHHFLAGYGGGKKAILPGVCGYETIMANHKLSLDRSGSGADPRVCAGRLKGNPLSEDMIEATNMTHVDFSVNVVINDDGYIGYVSCGDMVLAHEKPAGVVDEYFSVPIKEYADLVIASCGGYPKDINLYQTYKTIYNSRRAVKDGGVVIILSESREGIGNDKFLSIFTDYPDRRSREAHLKDNYDIASFEGYTVSLWEENVDFVVISSIDDKEIKSMGLIPAHSMDEALEYAYQKLGKNPQAYIMPHGSTTFPVLT